jgi:hypothetical protein
LRTILVVAFAALSLVMQTALVTGARRYINSYTIEEVENHHIVELNSNQPYLAGFHVDTDDLNTYGTIDGTAVTVSFLSTDTSFPKDTWLGGGMFVQAQDTKYKNVDYGFYTILAVDSSGSLFVDLGLHQTREETPPVQPGDEELIYSYTWRLSGVQLTTPVTLRARWDDQGVVSYSITANENTISIKSVKIAEIPNCENVIPKFYRGNVINKPFPFSNYVNFFQFGVTSSKPIEDNHWKVLIENPLMLKNGEWTKVSKAWSIQGNIAFLDQDWKWGGQRYDGVNAQYFNHSLQTPYQVIFEYTGETLTSGTVLWNQPTSQTGETATLGPPIWLVYCFTCGFAILWRLNSKMLGAKRRSWRKMMHVVYTCLRIGK